MESSLKKKNPIQKGKKEDGFKRLQDQDDSSGTEDSQDNIPILSSPSSSSYQQQQPASSKAAYFVHPNTVPYPSMYYTGSNYPYYPPPTAYPPSFQQFYQQPPQPPASGMTPAVHPSVAGSRSPSIISNTPLKINESGKQRRSIPDVQLLSSGTEDSDHEEQVVRKREKVKVVPGKRK